MSGDDVTITIRANNNDAVRAFRDTQGHLRDMRGRFVSESRIMSGALDGVTQSAGGAAGGLMTLKGAAIGLGAAAGVSLLPAIGALVPLLAGAGLAAGTLKLGFSGVGDAVKLAGEDQKKYNEAIKKMSPAQRDFTKSIVSMKKEFSGVGKEVQSAMLPGFTKAVKEAKPVVKILSDSMVDLGDSFGDIAEKAGRAMKDSGLQGDLRKNFKLGADAITEMATATGPLVRSLLDFGAKSKPSLDAITGLVSGLMDTGLPKFFAGLEPGIKGASTVIDGLAYAVNDKLLPALGDFSGQFAKAAGPLLGQTFKLLGDVGGVALNTLSGGMKVASPVLHDFSEGLRGIRTFAADVAPTLKDVGLALVTAFSPGDLGEGPLQGMADSIDRNKGAIQEGARVFGGAVLDMTSMAVENLPTIISAFEMVSKGVLDSIDPIVSGAAAAFGWIPGLGPKLKAANEKFDSFRDGFISSLDGAKAGAESFAASTLPKLEAGKLRLNINNWESQIATAKEQMKSVPPEKRAALKAQIEDLQAKVRQAKRELASVKDRSVTLTTWKITNVKTNYVPSAVKSGKGSLHDMLAGGGLVRGYAGGGNLQHFPDGGYVQGPGTPTSDSILASFASGATAAVSDTEYVVKAAAVRKYGVKMLDALNSGQLPVMRLAKGGVTKAEAEARRAARGDLTMSHFGQMAGYSRSEFASGLGRPDSVSALVNALNQWRGVILKATHGGQEKGLLRALDSAGKKLLAWEKQLGKVEASLGKAKDKLDSLKQSASQLADSVKSGVLSSASITRGASGDGPVTVASIMGSLTSSRDKANAFASALSQLKGMGLSSSLLQQLGDANIEGGGLETAGTLLGASPSEISSVNDLQAQITRAAGSAGKTTSDAVYGASIKAQTAEVKKLTASQDRLKASMDRLARSMERSIEKAFGGKAAGGIVGAASGGIRSSRTWVGEHGPELLDLPAGSRVWSNPDSRRKAAEAPWASMLTAPRRPAAGYAPSGSAEAVGGGQLLVVQLRIGEREFGEVWVNTGRREVRARGGIEATLRPPRGR
ncbi:hypothetical protein [Streptomyces griseorubiginosus]|uniref:hypothetical protein n=1 Tax=Streptomyces griseorubiginosus TaxID=67304 RepID=UPI0036F03F29